MTATPLHLAVALDGAGWHPAAWRDPSARPHELFTPGYWADVARTAERGRLDLLTIEDAFGLQSSAFDRVDDRVDQVRGRLDALLIAARVAPLTEQIGIVPTVNVTHTEPFHIGSATASLDYVTGGRAGWRPKVSARADEAAHVGRRTFPSFGIDQLGDPEVIAQIEASMAEAADVVEVVRRLWDSWEDDAIIKDAATGRFIDRDKLHYIDFEGPEFTVKGPSIVPRPPQGQPIVATLAHSRVVFELAARSSDVVFTTPLSEGDVSRWVADVRDAEVAVGRSGPPLQVWADLVVFLDASAGAAADRLDHLDERDGVALTSDAAIFTGTTAELADLLEGWQQSGLDGYRLRPGVIGHDLDAIVDGVVPELQRRELFRSEYQERTLRERLGLSRPASRYASQGRVTEAIVSRSETKQVILAAHFPGVNSTTVWSDPRSGSQIEFDSFVQLARTAERGRFDFFFLAEGLRLREQRGQIHDLDVVGRPDTLTVLSALAAVTDHLGLTGTLNSTFHEAYETARQVASLDHLSGGRAGWNVVTSSDAFTGENFRRGGYLDYSQRYERAREIIEVARTLWDSWGDDELVADAESGRFVRTGGPGAFAHHGDHFDIHGHFTVPPSPQRHPVILQAGDSDPGRELAAATADAIFSRHSHYEAGRAFHDDITRRLARYGRTPADIKVLPAATFALGDTPEEADEHARHIRRQQVSPATAILFAENLWNRDLSDHDPEGPLPTIEPDLSSTSIGQGRVRMFPDPAATVAQWRELAEERKLSLRDLVIDVLGRQTFIGTPEHVAETINRHVQEDAADGFILVPHLTPTGLDPFVDQVVPLLQERGVLRSEYETSTLRGHLGLPEVERRTPSRATA